MRSGFSIEKLLEITAENSDSGVRVLFGSGAPGGDTGDQDDAPLSSVYIRTDTFEFYQKLANAGAAADWYNYASLYTMLGVSKGDVDMGSFTGNILSDASDVKSLLQEMSDFIEKNVAEDDSADGVTSVTVIDDEDVDEILAATYEVVISLFDDESRRRTQIISISHDGTPSADATETDDTVYAKRNHGTPFNYTLSSGLSGSGVSQKMELRVASTETNGVNVRSRKISQVSA